MPNWLYNILKAVVGVAAIAVPAFLGAHTAVADYTVGGVILFILSWAETKFGVHTALVKKPVVKA